MNTTFKSLLRHNIIVLSTSTLLLLQRLIHCKILIIEEDNNECVVINGDKKIIHIPVIWSSSQDDIKSKIDTLLGDEDEDIKMIHNHLCSTSSCYSMTSSIDRIVIFTDAIHIDIRLQENHITSNIYHVSRFYKGKRYDIERQSRDNKIIQIPIELYVIDEHLIQAISDEGVRAIGDNNRLYHPRHGINVYDATDRSWVFYSIDDSIMSIDYSGIARYVFDELAFKT